MRTHTGVHPGAQTHNQHHLFSHIHLLSVGVHRYAHETHAGQNNQEATGYGQQNSPTSPVAFFTTLSRQQRLFPNRPSHSQQSSVKRCLKVFLLKLINLKLIIFFLIFLASILGEYNQSEGLPGRFSSANNRSNKLYLLLLYNL